MATRYRAQPIQLRMTCFRESSPKDYNKNLTLSDFQNSGVLLGLLANGPLGFSVNGHFYGSLDLPADLGCQIDPMCAQRFPDQPR